MVMMVNIVSFKVSKVGNMLVECVVGFNQDFDGLGLDLLWQVGGVFSLLINVGVFSYSFGMLDGVSVICLNSSIVGQYCGMGFIMVINVVGQGFSYEVCFNMLVQLVFIGFDEFIGLLMIDVIDFMCWVVIVLVSDIVGGGCMLCVDICSVGGMSYQNLVFNFMDNIWYWLCLLVVIDGNIKVILLSDVGVELMMIDFGIMIDVFVGGVCFGIYQFNIIIGGMVMYDVVIDWVCFIIMFVVLMLLILGQFVIGNCVFNSQ